MLMEGWCAQSRCYIKKFNAILDLKNKSELVKVINDAKEELQPNKECDHLFSSEKFLTKTIIKHKKENINCLCVAETPGEIRCEVCDESFKVLPFTAGVCNKHIHFKYPKKTDKRNHPLNPFTSLHQVR